MKRIVLLLLIAIPFMSLAQEKVTWDYPVKPGSEEWKAFQSNTEKVNACQVPNNILEDLTTKELLKVCLAYPLIHDILAFNNIQDDFRKFEKDFNGFKELVTRSDCAKELLKYYKAINPIAIPHSKSIVQKGKYVFSISFVELFMSYPTVISNFDATQKNEIVQELLLKDKKKKLRIHWYGSYGLQTLYGVLVKVIQSSALEFNPNYNLSETTQYINTGFSPNKVEVQKQIILNANNYLNR